MHVLHAHATPALARALRPLLLLCVAALLIAGIVGGLLRAGAAVPLPADGAWPGRAVLAHAFLLMCGFLGTVIGIERAVALKQRLAFAAPAAAAAGGTLMLMGLPVPAAWLAVLAALLFIAVSTVVVARQNARHTIVLLVAAAAWLVGNVLHALGARPAAVVPWWFSFLVLTIAAERLEMTRLMRRHAAAAPLLYASLASLLLGAAAFALSPVWGGWLYGTALIALAVWLACFDIARRTVAAAGLSRYMAVCLLLGYAWLAISGLGWIATSNGYAGRDVALHALGLGFVFGMVFAHAPVILPAVTGIKVRFGWFFYVPLIVLQASLALRLFGTAADLRMLSLGAAGNAAAIVLFIATLLGSAVAWRMQASREPGKNRHAAAAHD